MSRQLGLALGLGWILGFSLFTLVGVAAVDRAFVESFFEGWIGFLLCNAGYSVGLGIQGLVVGVVVGALLDRMRDIRIRPMFVVRHLIAFGGSVGVLMLVMEAIDRVGGWGEGLWGPFAVCACGGYTLIWVDCIMVPSAAVGEAAVMNRDWGTLSVVAVISLFTALAPIGQCLVWGVAYWSLFAAVTLVLGRLVNRSEHRALEA